MRPGLLLGVACLARALYPLDDSPDVVTRWDPLDCRNSTAPPCAFLAAARQCAQAPTQPCADERECPTAASRWLRGALHALHNGTARREKSFAPIREPPKLSMAQLMTVSQVALWLALGHIMSTVAPAYGTVAFTNVVKTLEPLFTCLFSAIFLNQIFALPVKSARIKQRE